MGGREGGGGEAGEEENKQQKRGETEPGGVKGRAAAENGRIGGVGASSK